MTAIVKEAAPAKVFWLSWYQDWVEGAFELHRPWWWTGVRADDGAATICAAIIAPDQEVAKALVVAAYERPPKSVEWRFCEERPNDWTPFCDRFERKPWMRWPEPTDGAEPDKTKVRTK